MTESPPPPAPSIYKQMWRGSAWTILMRWCLRGIGLVSILVLARVLTPEDFGIVAMASIVSAFIQGFSELGTSMALIREPNPSKAHCDTAWTIQILVGVLVGILLALLAEPAAWYFREPRVAQVLYVLAGSAPIAATENVGMVLVRKALDFATDFRFVVYSRLSTFFVTVALALLWRNYWALVAGQVLGKLVAVGLSYWMHPYRPRLSLEKARDYLTFSLYIVPINFARFLRERFGVLVVGRIGDTGLLGSYNVAAELAGMATQEIIFPLGRALFPSYATLVDDKKRLVEVFLHVLAAISMLMVPIGLGLSIVAEDFVYVVLGSQWTAAIPFLQWLAVYGLFYAWTLTLTGNILLVSGHERRAALAIWVNLAIMVPCVLAGSWLGGVQGVVVTITLSAVVALPLMAYLLTTALPVTFLQLATSVWPSVVAGLLMVAGILLLTKGVADARAAQLVLDVVVGAALYGTTLVCLWWLRGRPDGVERAVMDLLRRRLAKASGE